jgi:hypothetical protein
VPLRVVCVRFIWLAGANVPLTDAGEANPVASVVCATGKFIASDDENVPAPALLVPRTTPTSVDVPALEMSPRASVRAFDWTIVSSNNQCIFAQPPISGILYYDEAAHQVHAFALFNDGAVAADQYFVIGTKN